MSALSYICHRVFVKPALRLYLRRDRSVRFDGFKLLVRKGVFHPLLFFSTRIMYDFLKTQTLAEKKVLEIGSGSGLLSMLAYRSGASVTSVDIDLKAVNNTRENYKKNFADLGSLQVIQSDVFSDVPRQVFDLIIINPPYYFKKITHPTQQAWYCGENGEYFEKLFKGLPAFLAEKGTAIMILEENCDINRIGNMAREHGVEMNESRAEKRKWETSYIFTLRPLHSNNFTSAESYTSVPKL